jgi:hypothetical protein
MKFEIGTAYNLGAPPICASLAEAGLFHRVCTARGNANAQEAQ